MNESSPDPTLQVRLQTLLKQLNGPRDGALLRYSLALALRDVGKSQQAMEALDQALCFDADYSAAWKLLGRLRLDAAHHSSAAEAWRSGIQAAQRRGDKQAEKEMGVFLRRLERDQR